jgi:uncharacterized protein (UPF0332 family)
MPYHDELLDQAIDLAHKNQTVPTQADLRRSVSAAYYALFHLLISETVANWNRLNSRNALGRMFQHTAMAKASARISDSKVFPFIGEDQFVVQKLKKVAQAFVQLHDKRELADYDNATFWTRTEVLFEVKTAVESFSTWNTIRNENIAQEYLVSLFIKPRG